MHEQKNKDKSFKYFIDGKEVDNRTDYLNATMSGDYVSYFDGDSVFSVSFNSFFGENTDNNKIIKREVNGHVNSVLGGYNKPIIKSNSTRHKARENGKFHVVGYLEGINEPKYKETTLEELKENTINNVELGLTMVEILGVTLCDNKEYIYNMLARKIAEKENREQSSKTEENLVFPKDSEIHKEGNKNCNWTMCGQIECKHCYPNKEFRETKEAFNKSKEELPPFTTNYSDNFLDRFIKIYSGEIDKLETYKVDNWVKPNDFFTEEFRKDINSDNGIKESNGKTDYSEIDWDFIESLAKRMNKNKSKYEAGNYKKPMDINLLKQSLLRHTIEVLKNNYQDDEDDLGHLSAIALNAQFLHYQLKNNVK